MQDSEAIIFLALRETKRLETYDNLASFELHHNMGHLRVRKPQKKVAIQTESLQSRDENDSAATRSSSNKLHETKNASGVLAGAPDEDDEDSTECIEFLADKLGKGTVRMYNQMVSSYRLDCRENTLSKLALQHPAPSRAARSRLEDILDREQNEEERKRLLYDALRNPLKSSKQKKRPAPCPATCSLPQLHKNRTMAKTISSPDWVNLADFSTDKRYTPRQRQELDNKPRAFQMTTKFDRRELEQKNALRKSVFRSYSTFK